MRTSWTISRYLIGAIVPYFLSAWLLLSVILFVQQASRFSDIFFSVNIPNSLIWQLAFALVPNVIAFTCPMAVLVGTVIGLSKMQGDNELVVIRAAGVSNLQILVPAILLGVLLSFFTFMVNLLGVPLAARIVRQVALQTAIYKLESPIEPGVFNTEVAGYTIYVKDGDLTDGKWKNIFIHTEDPKTGETRLITSRQGRIDSEGESSELVLENALSTTITPDGKDEKFVSETIGEVRFAIKTRRNELIERLARSETSAEEMGLSQLSEFARSKEGRERTEAEILWQRRILLSITPLIFSILGTVLVLRFNRGGRGFGVAVSLAVLITYYLAAFLGEQLARTGWLSVPASGAIPIALAAIAIIWFTYVGKIRIFNNLAEQFKVLPEVLSGRISKTGGHSFFRDMTTGLRDFDFLYDLVRYYILTLLFLSSIFVIFTAFELWRYAGTMDGGIRILGLYLLYLVPFIYLQLSPSAAMIATLSTYIIKSRQNEIVTWTSVGQSVYRLLVPCFALMLFLGLLNFAVQELLAPTANLKQDLYRQQLRSRGSFAAQPTRFWVANDKSIISFTNIRSASDNDTAADGVTIYEFSDNGENLQTLYRSENANWSKGKIVLQGPVRRNTFENGAVSSAVLEREELEYRYNPFKEIRKKPSQLTIGETKERIKNSESEVEERNFEVAFERKWSTLVLPFIIALFTAPFALSLNRKGKAVTVGYAVGLWLIFMATTSVFDQLALSGLLPSAAAVWAPLGAFAMLGIFLLSRVRT